VGALGPLGVDPSWGCSEPLRPADALKVRNVFSHRFSTVSHVLLKNEIIALVQLEYLVYSM